MAGRPDRLGPGSTPSPPALRRGAAALAAPPTPVTRAAADRDELIAWLLALFAFTDAESTTLAEAIYAGRITAMLAAVNEALTTLAVPLWTALTDAALQQSAVSAHQHAAQIAATYRQDLATFAAAYLTTWEAAHDTLIGARDPLVAATQQMAQTRAVWKADQIARTEVGDAVNRGVERIAQQYLDGTISSAAATAAGVYVAVVPGYSSHDACADYAGEVYSLDDLDALPAFPLHVQCIHQKLLMLGDQELDG